MEFITITGNVENIISSLKNMNIKNDLFNLGVTELEEVAKNINIFGVPQENYKIDLTIARGLDYYTGTVYETTLINNPEIGSVASGGRYENLAGYYTNKKKSSLREAATASQSQKKKSQSLSKSKKKIKA